MVERSLIDTGDGWGGEPAPQPRSHEEAMAFMVKEHMLLADRFAEVEDRLVEVEAQHAQSERLLNATLRGSEFSMWKRYIEAYGRECGGFVTAVQGKDNNLNFQ